MEIYEGPMEQKTQVQAFTATTINTGLEYEWDGTVFVLGWRRTSECSTVENAIMTTYIDFWKGKIKPFKIRDCM